MSDATLIPVGKWSAVPTGAALGETKDGKEQVGVSFDLPDVGRSITWYGYFTEKTARRTIESLRYCGWKGDDLSDLSSIGTDPSVEVQLVIEHDTYEGVTRAKVTWVNAPGGVAIQKPLDDGKKVALAQRMKGLVLDVSKSTNAAAQRQAPRGNGAAPITGHLDDDVPF